MKQSFLLSVLLIFPLLTLAQTNNIHENIKIFARIKTTGQRFKIIPDKSSPPVASSLKKESLVKEIAALEPGDEALIEGHMIYETSMAEGKKILKPVFLIEEIHPVSLKRLGKADVKEFNQEIHIEPLKYDDGRRSIPVTGEVASAITITASLLMLQGMAPTDQGQVFNKDLNSGLIFSAGALATGLFIYDQIKGKQKKGK